VTRVECVIEIDAGENGEDVSLQESNQQFERRQRDDADERQRRNRSPTTRRDDL
jgi:hypothetical protein